MFKLFIKTIILFTLIVLVSACGPDATATPSAPTAPAMTTPDVSPTTTAKSTGGLPVPTTLPAAQLSFEKSTQQFTASETFQAGLGDLDGDGDLDAVFANPQRNNSQVWLNDGNGSLVDTGQKLTQYGHGVVLADFDEDGDLDAFIVCHQFVTPSKIYLNDGHGAMSDTGQDLGDASLSANEVNLLDLNGDGHIDVHVMYYSPTGLPDKVYLNDGRANFSDSGLILDEETIAWGDLDGDGDVDYFGKRQGKGYVAQLNNGSGQFSEGWQTDDTQATIGGVVLADFDIDGDLDALVTNGFRDTGSFPSHLFLNDGTGQFTDSDQTLNPTLDAKLAVGDLDLDGDLDVFVSNMSLPNEVWLNDGRGHLSDSGLRLEGNNSAKPTLGDIDGDGDLDVFIGSLMNKPQMWFNMTITSSEAPVLPTLTPTPVLATISADTAGQIELLSTLSGHSKRVIGIVFSGDGRYIVSSRLYQKIKLWDVASVRLLRFLLHNNELTWLFTRRYSAGFWRL